MTLTSKLVRPLPPALLLSPTIDVTYERRIQSTRYSTVPGIG